MAKTVITATITNNKEKLITKTTAIKTNKEYKYQEKDKTKVIFNYIDLILKRENQNILIELFLKEKNSKGKIFLKDLSKELLLEIETVKVLSNEKTIEIYYKIDKENYYYRIEEI